MYWFRRTLLAVVVVAVVAAIGWWVVDRGTGPKIDPAAATVGTTAPKLTGVLAAETTTEVPDLEADSSATGTASSATSGSTSTSPGLTTRPTTANTTSAATAAATTASGQTVGKTGPVTTTGAAAKTTPATATKASTKTTAKAAATTAATAKTTTPKTTAPKTTAPPKPSYDAAGNLICPDSAITVTATTQGSIFPAGSQPRLGMRVTNSGKATCVRDVSGSLQVYTVYTAAGARIWSTADCVPGEGHEVRQLAPGTSANFLIIWSGKTSNPGCTATRVRVKPGEYKLIAQLGALTSKPVAFTMR